MDGIIKEAIKIWLNMNEFKRDGGFTLSKAWDVVINMLTRSKAKQHEHFTLPANTQRLATDFKLGIRSGTYM
jgi:hypothetical protein